MACERLICHATCFASLVVCFELNCNNQLIHGVGVHMQDREFVDI